MTTDPRPDPLFDQLQRCFERRNSGQLHFLVEESKAAGARALCRLLVELAEPCASVPMAAPETHRIARELRGEGGKTTAKGFTLAAMKLHTGDRAPTALIYWDAAATILERCVRKATIDGRGMATLAAVHVDRGRLSVELGRWDAARHHLDRAVELGDDLTQVFPERPEPRDLLAEALTQLGGLDHHMGRPHDAESHLRRALGLRRRVCKAFPEFPGGNSRTASTLLRLAELEQETDQPEVAERSLVEATLLSRQDLERAPSDPLLQIRLALASVALGEHVVERDPGVAENILGRAEETLAALRDEHDDLMVLTALWARAMGRLACVHDAVGQSVQARDMRNLCLDSLSDLVTRMPTRVDWALDFCEVAGDQARTIHTLGQEDHPLPAEGLTGENDAVQALLETAFKVGDELQQAFPKAPRIARSLATALESRGDVALEEERREDALEDYLHAERVLCASGSARNHERSMRVASKLAQLAAEGTEE